MNPQVSKIFRSVQIYFPFLQDYRFQVQRGLRHLLNRTHEQDFDLLTKLPKSDNNLFIDVGSNRGDSVHSILMRRPDARVIGFEPNPFLADKVRKLYRNDRRVQLHTCGLAHQTGTFTLHIPFYHNYMFDGLASFREESARGWLRNRIYGYDEKQLRIAKAVCEVRTLDDFNLKPYFIKIDVQGFEYEVLLGAKRTIDEARPVLLIETPGKPEVEFLSFYGYTPYVYTGSRLVPGVGGLNVFFFSQHHKF